MSIARHHVEWLSLLEVSGPFLSLPVLMQTFPQGLEGIEPHLVGTLRTGYEEWQAGVEKRTPSIHDAWVRFVLRNVLGIPDDAVEEGQAIPEAIRASFAEHGETLRPDLVIAESSSKRRRLLVQIYPATQDLEKAVRGKTWSASPATRMMELLHATGVRLGLVTNGERWMLVDAPRDQTTGYTSWYAGLWLEERITLQAFRSLLGAERFFNVPEAQTLEALLTESSENQQEVTDQLGYQVRKAVEVLVEALDRADQDHSRALLANVPETELYEAALTVMMRLVFLFCAEERELLLLGEPLFDEHYAVSTLREQLREAADQHGEDVLERRHDAWNRLLATFRAVHGGIRHERLVIPPYGGTLLDPDRFPFLEGRKPGTTWRTTPAEPLPVNNRTVLHLLDALQVLQVRLPGGGTAEARKVSFRALDIEQIGYVYEGLLDHTAVRATEPVLGLAGTRNKTKDWEAEVPLSTLEALRKKGEKELAVFLKEQTNRSAGAIERALTRDLPPDELRRVQGACGSGSSGANLWSRLQPFAGLVRGDSFGYPVVIQAGSVYVTEGSDRRSTGTQYTPRILTEPVVQHALEPLVFLGPAEGWPREEWKLRSAREILALKLCDFACGSGAFLVQTCRYLADRLLEAWSEVEREDPAALRITPEGDVSQGLPEERLIPEDPDERLTFARRLIAQRCLYGVDVNPLAVEMAKLSLWLLTLAKDQPFTFLDHAIRCGDSLLGITSLDQLKRFSLVEGPIQKTLSQTDSFDAAIDDAIGKRLRLEAIEGNTAEHVEAQKHLLKEAEEGLGRLKAAADQLIGAEIGDLSRDEAIRAANSCLLSSSSTSSPDVPSSTVRCHRRPFHWPLEFPEVVVKHGGFDGFLGNPPFMGGTLISGNLGKDYQIFLTRTLASVRTGGRADLCAYFFIRAVLLVRKTGMVGLLATKTIAQGDTRETGLEQILKDGLTIPRAIQSRKWPGKANLEVAHIWIRKAPWSGEFFLNDEVVPGINALLAIPGAVEGKPHKLRENADLSFSGSYVLGTGFVLEPEEAQALIAKSRHNRDVLFPYLIGDDILSRPDQSPSRWVMNFFDWPEERGKTYTDVMAIAVERVKPDRQRRKPDGSYVLRKPLPERWWQYGDKRPKLYSTIREMKRCLVHPLTSKHHAFVFCTPGIVMSHMTVVVALDGWNHFALLQSEIHWKWALEWGNKLESRPQYTNSDCFETFPFPPSLEMLGEVGAEYYELRRKAMAETDEGLTRTLNRLHDPREASPSITALRDVSTRMDCSVANAYGWGDLELDHGFHETKQGIRFTVSEPARREVLDRLLKLNHQRHAEEMKKGAQDKKPRKDRGGLTESDEGNEPSLF
jgi:hypothetical protein